MLVELQPTEIELVVGGISVTLFPCGVGDPTIFLQELLQQDLFAGAVSTVPG